MITKPTTEKVTNKVNQAMILDEIKTVLKKSNKITSFDIAVYVCFIILIGILIYFHLILYVLLGIGIIYLLFRYVLSDLLIRIIRKVVGVGCCGTPFIQMHTQENRPIQNRDNRIYIWMDWSSAPFWIPKEKDSIYLRNYPGLEKYLPEELSKRFEIWADWFNKNEWPNGKNLQTSNNYSGLDLDLYQSYGKVLACDLKKLFPELRIFFGHITSDYLIEIELLSRSVGDIVCVSKKTDPIKYKG